MPIPEPRKNEKNSEFMNRCMNFLEKKGEFKDVKQRAAVCYGKLSRRKKN